MKQQWIIKDNHQLRIDDFVYQQNVSKKALKIIKLHGEILVNGEHQTVRYQLNKGDHLELIYPDEINRNRPIDMPLKIIYEDEYLLILDKQKGIPCIPTRSHPDYTLTNALTYYYQQNHINATIHLVNRLDKETRGLMIVAKNRHVHNLMSQNTHIYRLYRMHVQGYVDESGTINKPIYKQEKQMQRLIDERGQEAITHYRLIKKENNQSIVECLLETGRTHQIRIHMASIGHPLIGDSLYGDGIGDFDLTSIKVGFIHPITKQMICIERKICL